MISIFNGKSRNLGKGLRQDVFIQVSVELRKHLHLLKGARLGVLMCISLHSDPEGWAFPSVDTIKRETGYNEHTIHKALDDLCKLILDGSRILLRHQRVNIERGYFESNRYLLFPSPEEIEKWEKKSANPTAQNVHTVEPCASFPQSVKPHAVNVHTNKNQLLNQNHDKQEPLKSKSATRMSNPSDSDVFARALSDIFDYWKVATGHTKAKLKGRRERAVRARLKDGFTVHQIKLAIEGCLDSPFHAGDNPTSRVYDDLELICRDAAKLEPLMRSRIASVEDKWTTGCCKAERRLFDAKCVECGAQSDFSGLHDQWLQAHVKSYGRVEDVACA